MSGFNCCFLTSIQVSREADKMVWYSHLFKNFPWFVVIYTVKGFSIVNEAEVHIFLEVFCFYDPTDVGNLISGSSAFSQSSLDIWNFSVHILLKPILENFELYFASVWDECNCAVVWTFFGIAFLWDWNENWPFPVLWVFQICWYIECSTFTASSFRILNNSAEFPRRRQWHPTPVLLPGKSHGWRRLVGCSPWDHEESDMTERLHFHFSLSCIGEGNGNPLQCSCLENPRVRGAWWAAVYGVTQSRTWLKQPSSSSSSWVFQICWYIECSTFTASSFRILNNSAGIPSPPLALFVVLLPKAHLTSHSKMFGSRWVITSLWLSRSLRSFKKDI